MKDYVMHFITQIFIQGRNNMSCRFASRTDEYHGWKCSESDGACVFFVPNEQRCYDEYGEGPLAFEENPEDEVKENQNGLEK